MRLVESLQKNIFKTSVGGLWNKFKGKDRRDTLFFEDIVAEYVLLCEQNGYKKEMRLIGQEWMSKVNKELIPNTFKLLPSLFLNTMMKNVWINLGLLDDFHSVKKDDSIVITTKNEIITRIIGRNEIAIGAYMGVLMALYKTKIIFVSGIWKKDCCEYTYKITKNSISIPSKKRVDYCNSNKLTSKTGFELKDAFKKNIFSIRKNHISFRKKSILVIENTVFHLVANKNILFEKIPEISYNYFNVLIDSGSSDIQKMKLIKNILQIMGWGNIKIMIRDFNVRMIIKNPPTGLQLEKDNWNFVVSVILGYLWVINGNYKLIESTYSNKILSLDYCFS